MPEMSVASIEAAIVAYVISNHVSAYTAETVPRDQSLMELGVLDSYGVVELVSFLENEWHIKIADDEITREKLGSIAKMAALVAFKLTSKS